MNLFSESLLKINLPENITIHSHIYITITITIK